MLNFLDLLFRKVLSDFILINNLPPLQFLFFDPLDALTFDITSTDQHTFESSEAKIVVTLRWQLLVTKPEIEEHKSEMEDLKLS